MRFRPASLLLAMLLWLPAHAQSVSQPERRTIAVSALDKDGKTVTGLTAADFRGDFRGQPVKILSAELDTNPRRIALVVDMSASLRESKPWTCLWSAADDFVTTLGGRNPIAVSRLLGM
jgi:hypothetical protein